jgi:simple sugar transport system permease protein
MATYNNVPSQLISIIQAVIFVFFAAEQFLAKYRQKLVVRTAQEEMKEAQQEKIAEGGTK